MKEWNTQRRQQAIAAGSISVNGYIKLGKELQGTYQTVMAYDLATNAMVERKMVFYQQDNPNLMQNPHSDLVLPKGEIAPERGAKVNVRVVFIFKCGTSLAELL